MVNRLSDYEEWYGETVYQLERIAECCTSDAQGIIDAQPANLSNCWIADYTPEQTAQFINEQSLAIK